MEFYVFIGIWIGLWLYNKSSFHRDTTDQPGWFAKRSSLCLYTDYATGVQYVRGGLFGGLQPRRNADGSIVNIYESGDKK